jgi:hypothetical protein
MHWKKSAILRPLILILMLTTKRTCQHGEALSLHRENPHASITHVSYPYSPSKTGTSKARNVSSIIQYFFKSYTFINWSLLLSKQCCFYQEHPCDIKISQSRCHLPFQIAEDATSNKWFKTFEEKIPQNITGLVKMLHRYMYIGLYTQHICTYVHVFLLSSL